YAWDARGLLVAETRGEPVDHPKGTSNLPTWRFTYDVRGNRETATDPNGTVQAFSHDDAGRLTGRTVQKATGVGGVDATSFTLDVLGRPYAEWAQSGPARVDRTRRFDSLGRAREETLRIGTGPQRSLGRTFDASDNPVSLTYPSGRMISRAYDPLNRIAEVQSAAGDVLAHYDDLGSRQLRKVLGNGLTEERQYDDSGWLEHLDVGPAANPNGTFSVTYGRNGRSLKTGVTRADLGKRHAYEYDAASRILREQLGLLEPPPPDPAPNPPEVENYLTLDGLLNIVTEERTEAGTKVTTSSATNSRNQVTQWGSDAATYDANGNVGSFRGRTLHYDADSRLVSAALPGGGTYEVLRDASGRKVRETLTASGTSHAVDVVQDGDRTLETFAVNEGVPLESLVYGRGIDEVVRADLDPDGDGTATTVIPIQDELGNVAYLTGSDGTVLERYDYETYGRFRVFAPDGSARTTSAFGWNRLFQGREYVAALEAYDFRNRHLLPALGRFAQEDPLGYVDSLNLYQAFGGGWVNATDPWGLCVFGLPCPKAAQAAIDWAGVAVDTTVANLKGIGAEALRFGQKAADVATGGVSAGFRSAASAAATASGSSTERLGETGQAFLRGQLESLTQGFSEADEKVGHA
ncbi:MAG TPA: RHS repeat-associated core domain-containing protein, partial [Thermoanaerobaculia bacterium]|nr:RHS repeat-associated core domain-containing protein [Thermoanaerobaculia bacterium]